MKGWIMQLFYVFPSEIGQLNGSAFFELITTQSMRWRLVGAQFVCVFFVRFRFRFILLYTARWKMFKRKNVAHLWHLAPRSTTHGYLADTWSTIYDHFDSWNEKISIFLLTAYFKSRWMRYRVFRLLSFS